MPETKTLSLEKTTDEIFKENSSYFSAAQNIINHIPRNVQLSFFSTTYPKELREFIFKIDDHEIIPITIPRREQINYRRLL